MKEGPNRDAEGSAPSTVAPRQAEAQAQAEAGNGQAQSSVLQQARPALAAARELHREGRDEEAIDVLVEWLDAGGPSPPSSPTEGQVISEQFSEDPDFVEVHQAMIALGCWLCNTLSTRHLHARRVARAFGYTRTCERWLAKVKDNTNGEMWLRLRYDRALNAAELAQSSDDQPKAIVMLHECERLQAKMQAPPNPEAVHLCLAEVLQQSGQYVEAANAAAQAIDLLRQQNVEGNERKVYSLVFALSLEQAALASLAGIPLANAPAPSGSESGLTPTDNTVVRAPPPVAATPPVRAMRCLSEAEAAWTMNIGADAGPINAASDAVRGLLAQMRYVHRDLVMAAAASQTAVRTGVPQRAVRPGTTSSMDDMSEPSTRGPRPTTAPTAGSRGPGRSRSTPTMQLAQRGDKPHRAAGAKHGGVAGSGAEAVQRLRGLPRHSLGKA